jgi:hypothetical protein
MKVHLVRSPELPILNFESICDFIGCFDGEIQFTYTEDNTFVEVINVEVDEYRIKRIGENFEPKNDIDNEPFFDKCEEYRTQHNIPNDELVILLTQLRNDNNYFGYVSKGMNNVFIQTSNWGAIFGEDLDDQLPIVYEIAVWTLRHLLFKFRGEMISSINQKSMGCVMDMCKSKDEISLKMRTGDISPNVVQLIKDKKVNPLYLKQLISIFEKIRTGILFRERCQILNNPSRLELKDIKSRWRLVLVDFGDVILNFEFTQLTVYLLFLRHPEGLEMRDIENYRNEIDEIYRSVCPSKKSDENIEKTVLKLSSFENITYLNEVISRINKELKNKIPSSIIDLYIIKGERGGVYSVGLDRKLVAID